MGLAPEFHLLCFALCQPRRRDDTEATPSWKQSSMVRGWVLADHRPSPLTIKLRQHG
jgi:hypothetical protein